LEAGRRSMTRRIIPIMPARAISGTETSTGQGGEWKRQARRNAWRRRWVTASKKLRNFFATDGLVTVNTQSSGQRDAPDVETNDWRAVCGRTARTVRREGRRKPSLPLSKRRPWTARLRLALCNRSPGCPKNAEAIVFGRRLTPMERYLLAKKIAAMTPKDVVQTDSVLLLREDRDR
jgi:hypothetical protein